MGSVMILMSLPTLGHESFRLRHKKMMNAIRRQRDKDFDRNGHQEGNSGDWQTIHVIDDIDQTQGALTPEVAERKADEELEKRAAKAYLVQTVDGNLCIHVWGLAAE